MADLVRPTIEMRDPDGTLRGYVIIGSGLNDIKIVSLLGDPVNVEIGTTEGLSLGAVSWGRVRADGQIEQKVLFQGKISENTRFNPDVKDQGGEFSLHIHDGQRHARDDDSMRPVVIARSDMVWIKRLVTAAEMPDGLPGWVANTPPPGPAPAPAPAPVPVPVQPPAPGIDYPPGTQAIAVGDFAALSKFYGNIDLADEESDYRAGKMQWAGPHTGFSVLWMAYRKSVPTDPTAGQP